MAEEGAVRPVKYNAQTMVEILASFNIKVTQQDLKQQSVISDFHETDNTTIEIFSFFLMI